MIAFEQLFDILMNDSIADVNLKPLAEINV
jgi:hypothetical protein